MIEEISLANMLVSNNLSHQEINQGLISGFEKGITRLRNEEEEYDGINSSWYGSWEIEIGERVYNGEINDVGSGLNVNYQPEELQERLDISLPDFTEEHEFPLTDLRLIKDKGEDFNQINEKFTVYGDLNLNTVCLEKLEEYLEFKEVGSYEKNIILNYVRKKHNEEEKIEKLTELVEEGLSLLVLEEIDSYLTVDGQSNINFVDREVLKSIISYELELSPEEIEKRVSAIVNHRKKEIIKELEELRYYFSESEMNAIIPYFTVVSQYFSIEIKFKNNYQDRRIKSIVKRMDSGDKYKIIKWEII